MNFKNSVYIKKKKKSTKGLLQSRFFCNLFRVAFSFKSLTHSSLGNLILISIYFHLSLTFFRKEDGDLWKPVWLSIPNIIISMH
jgi:hypothetical protein